MNSYNREQVFHQEPRLSRKWEQLEKYRKRFTWPDRPVLFDEIEAHFLGAGVSSPLMYLHNSPGMLRLKRKWCITDRQVFAETINHEK